MLVPEAAVKVQLDSPAPLSASPPPTHTHPVKGIGAQNTTFWQNALDSFTQTRQHSHRLDQDEDEYEHEDDEYDDRTQQKQLLRGPAAKMVFLFFSRAAAKLLKSFSLGEIFTTLFLFGSFTMPNEK